MRQECSPGEAAPPQPRLRPYRDYRPVYAVVVVTSLLIAFLMLNNIETYYRYVSETREHTDEDRSRSNPRREQEQRPRRGSTTSCARSTSAALRQQTTFINAQLAERAFSWSELLDRLERVLPRRRAHHLDSPRVQPERPRSSRDGLRGEKTGRDGGDDHSIQQRIRSSATRSPTARQQLEQAATSSASAWTTGRRSPGWC